MYADGLGRPILFCLGELVTFMAVILRVCVCTLVGIRTVLHRSFTVLPVTARAQAVRDLH